MMPKTQIIETIQKIKKPFIVAISGFGGSGKTTFANLLASEIHAPIIGVDDFFNTTERLNYERWEIYDFERLELEVIKPFLSGGTILSYIAFDWEKNELTGFKTTHVDEVLIVEGVGLFRPELMKYFSYTIWIECPIEIAIERGKKRDRNMYGVSQDEKWDGIWRNNEMQCYREFDPMENAERVIKYNEADN
jgi:uridine kinase